MSEEDQVKRLSVQIGHPIRESIRKDRPSVSKRVSLLSEGLLGLTNEALYAEDENPDEADDFDEDANFDSYYVQEEMRCLALIAHNNMKGAMKQFVDAHKNLLSKFRLTGTNTTMTMLKTVFGEDNPEVLFGPTCSSGPLGGDAQVCAQLCLEDIGGIFFFMDPLSAHPHEADIQSLVRLANVHNVMLITNPTTAHSMITLLQLALENGRKDLIPSFFLTLESPSVKAYQEAQKKALDLHTGKGGPAQSDRIKELEEQLENLTSKLGLFLKL